MDQPGIVMSRIIPTPWMTPLNRRALSRLLLTLSITLGAGHACTPGDSGGADANVTGGARLTTRGAGDLLFPDFSRSEPDGRSLEALWRPLATGPRPEQMTIDSLGVDFGTPEASVRMMEFFDFGCGYCRTFHEGTRGLLHEQYVDSGQILWKSVPFVTGNWPASVPVSLAAECARDQGRSAYAAIADVIFARQREWKSASAPEELAEEFAEEAGLDMERYRSCFENDELLWRVQAHTELATEFGVRGTPTFYIIGFGPIVGALPLEALQQMFDTVLAEVAAGQR